MSAFESSVEASTGHKRGVKEALLETKGRERHVILNRGRRNVVLLLGTLRQLSDALVLETQHLRDRV